MDYIIRKAVSQDEAAIRELYKEMLRTIFKSDEVNGYDDGYLDKFFSEGQDVIFVAEDDKVFAFTSAEVYHEPEDYVYFDDISVSSAYRNKGIGTMLIKKAEDYVKEIGMSVIVFHVEKSNESAFRLYERLGYSIFRDDGSRYLMRKDV